MSTKDKIGWFLIAFAAFSLFKGGGVVAPVGPPPIAGAGLMVLVAYEEDLNEFSKYTEGEQRAITSTADGSVRDFCNDHCIKGPDGKTPEAVFVDDDSDFALMPDHWKPAWERRPHDSAAGLPWIVVSNGRSGYEGPMPDTEAETLAILKKVGGL